MKQTFHETEPLDDDWISGRTAMNEGIPWIVPSAIPFLEGIVRPDWKVFEWGAGGSTVWFAKNCAEVVSVEADPDWKIRMDVALAGNNLEDKVILLHVPIAEHDPDYYNSILAFPDHHFDLVFVDGDRENRNACIDAALRKVKPGGWLLVDNTNWSSETPALLNIEHWDAFEFEALPFVFLDEPGELTTTFFRKPEL